MHIPLYTGRSAPFARLAAYWLHKLASYQHWGGRGIGKLRQTCRINHLRNVEIAASEARNACLMAKSEGGR
jgi:hypothetical protein